MASGWPGKGHGALLKNSLALSSAPRPAAKYDVSVVFWPYFRALLETRSDRQPLFQQAETFYDVGCIAFSLSSSAYLIPSASR